MKRILLYRNGESQANLDTSEYCRTPDWKIPLTARGESQALDSGRHLKELVGDEPVYIYHSPYVRTARTLELMLDATKTKPLNIQGIQEDARLRDADFGNLKDFAELSKCFLERQEYGKFFYRFPNGESGADVCDRVTSFLDAFQREQQEFQPETNVVLVVHGLTIRMFVHRWFHLTVEHFEQMVTPPNGSAVKLDRVPHTPRFVLSPESITWLNMPTSLHGGNGYQHRNKAILGSISLGAPYL